MGEVATRFKNLFKLHRFSYGITFSNGIPYRDGSNKHLGTVRSEIERALDDLALSGQTGDGITIQLVKS